VFTFLRWTEQAGRGWRILTDEQFLEYSRMRQAQPDQGGAGLARSSWNTELSAVSAFYNAAVELGIVAKSPIRMRAARTTNRFGDLAKPGALVPAGRKPQTKRKIKWLRLDQYTKFRDEGLRKLRFPERNAAFADFMLVTEARRAEGSALRLSDVPELRDPKFEGKRTVKWSVPDEDAKGGEGRDSWISKLALRRMIAYRDVERDVQMALAIEAGRYSKGPGAFWLNQNGEPMGMRGWNAVFAAAEEMCGVHCTPHMLRHTFAIYTLHNLVQIAMAEAAKSGVSHDYRKITRDPCRELQRLMGHVDWSTTLIYLDYIGDLDGHTDDRLDYFDRRILLEADYGR